MIFFFKINSFVYSAVLIVFVLFELILIHFYRPASNLEDRTQGTVDADTSEPVKLDAQAHAHIEKQR